MEPSESATTQPPASQSRQLARPVLASMAVIFLAVAFALLTEDVLEGETRGFDLGVRQFVRSCATHPWGPRLLETMRDISGLGSVSVLVVITTASVGFLMLVRARLTACLVVLSIASATAMVSFMKDLFGRQRPDPALAEHLGLSLSFPSGHAAMSAVVFFTLGALLASTRESLPERLYTVALATLLTGLVGISRIFLGVHWATDVVAGWVFGSGWALLWLMVTISLRARLRTW
ncbi:MAG: phosphatase PAP2 family protein [Burkholderiales bacterium]|nr:phosphatase PAP2 family protein [Burkholderiales bacterium]